MHLATLPCRFGYKDLEKTEKLSSVHSHIHIAAHIKRDALLQTGLTLSTISNSILLLI